VLGLEGPSCFLLFVSAQPDYMPLKESICWPIAACRPHACGGCLAASEADESKLVVQSGFFCVLTPPRLSLAVCRFCGICGLL